MYNQIPSNIVNWTCFYCFYLYQIVSFFYLNVSLNSIQFLAERKLYLKNNDCYLLEDFLKCLIIVRQEIVESSFLLLLESEIKRKKDANDKIFDVPYLTE